MTVPLHTHYRAVRMFTALVWRRDTDGDRIPWRVAWTLARLAYYVPRIYRA